MGEKLNKVQNQWVSLFSASKRLDKSTEATRKLVKRKRIIGKKSIDNRWIVSVDSLEYYANNISTSFDILEDRR